MMSLLFSTTELPLSKAIRWLTKSEASHVSIGFSLYQIPFVLEASLFGVKISHRDRFLLHKHLVAEFLCPPTLEAKLPNALLLLGAAYDFGSLFGFLYVMLARHFKKHVRNPLASSKALLCSELIVCMDLAGAVIPEWRDLDRETTTPQDLLDICRNNPKRFPLLTEKDTLFFVGSITFEKTQTAAPFTLTALYLGTGITGLVPTLAIRNAATIASYFDFSDETFKTSGWTTKFATLTEIGNGHYQKTLDISAIVVFTIGLVLAAEYHFSAPPLVGDDLDLIEIIEQTPTIALLRKQITNKMNEASGTPGSLVLFDDDNTTPLLTWTLRDEFGGGVIPATGTPARRTKAT